MRVYDCDECGETVSAADDPELKRAVGDHFAERHGGLEEAELDRRVAEGAYDATDS